MSKSQTFKSQRKWQTASITKTTPPITCKIKKMDDISYPISQCLFFDQEVFLSAHPLTKYINGDNLVIPLDKINKIHSSGLALIHYAAKAADVELLKLLLNNGAKINLKTQYPVESGEGNVTALSLVLHAIKQTKVSEEQDSLNKLINIKEILLDYGASRLDIRDARIEEERQALVENDDNILQTKKKSNEEIVKKCAKGDKKLEKLYLDFYNYLQMKLIISINNGKQFSKILSQEKIEKIVQDFASKITKYHREDIATADKDLGHKLDSPQTKKFDDYDVKEQDILPHWDKLADDTVKKFNKYLLDNPITEYSINHSKNFGTKIAKSFLPKWHKGKMIFTKIKKHDMGEDRSSKHEASKETIGPSIVIQTLHNEDKGFKLDIASNLAQIAELSYKSRKKIEATTEKWGFKLIAFRQSDSFKSIVMHNDESMVIAFRGTYHNSNWLSNADFITKDIKVRGEKITVHRGFYKAMKLHWSKEEGGSKKVQQMSEDLGRELERPLKESVEKLLEQKPHLKIYIAGHSLGGAMAANAYLQLLNIEVDGQPLSINQILLYTYGQPLWCSKTSYNIVEQYFNSNYYRVVNYQDLVPTVPPEQLGFRHLGELFYLNKDGIILDQTGFDRVLTLIEKSANPLTKLLYIANHSMFLYTRKLQNGEQPYIVKKLTMDEKKSLLDKLSHEHESKQQIIEEKLDLLSEEALKKLKSELSQTNQKKSELLECFREQVEAFVKAKVVEAVATEQSKLKQIQLTEITQTVSNTPLHSAAKRGDLAAVKNILYSGRKAFSIIDRQVLHCAAQGGNSEIVKLLLETVPGIIEAQDQNGRNALHYAVQKGSLEIVKLLLEKSPRMINVKDNFNNTVLDYAAAGGRMEIVKLLLEIQPKLINAKDKDDKTVLHNAAQEGNLEFVKLLLEIQSEMINAKDKDGETVLHYAVRGEKLEIVELLLEKKPELINAKDKDGETVLRTGVKGENVGIVKLLLEKKPELIDSKVEYGETVLYFAIEGGNLEIVKLLLEKKPELIDYKNYSQYAFLHNTIEGGNLEIVKLLLEKRPGRIDLKDSSGDTALHYATKAGNLEIVKLLLEKKPGLIDMTNNCGDTALHYATKAGNLDIVKLLLEKKPDFIYVTSSNVLHSAAIGGNLDIVKLLLEKESSLARKMINIEINGTTPLYHAAMGGNLDIVKFLLLETKPELIDSKVKYWGERSGSIMQAAIRARNSDMVKLLLEAKPELIEELIDRTVTDTALHLAIERGSLEIVKLLLEIQPELIYVKRTYNNSTVLHHAAEWGNVEIVKLLLEIQPELINMKDNFNNTVLNYAVTGKNLEIVQLLLEIQPELINVIDQAGKTNYNYAMLEKRYLYALEIAIYDIENISDLDMVATKIDNSILVAKSYYRYAVKILTSGKTNLFNQAIEKSLQHNSYDFHVSLLAAIHQIDLSTVVPHEYQQEIKLFQRGISFIAQQEYSQAINILSNINQTELENFQRAELALTKTYCQVKLGQIEEAIDSLQLYYWIADLSQVSAAIYYYCLGEIALQENADNLSEALDYFQKSLRFDSVFLEGKIAIGKIYYRLSKYQEAEQIFEGVLKDQDVSYLGDQLSVCEQMLTNSKVRLYIQKEDSNIESFNSLENKIVTQIMHNIIIDVAGASDWLLQHLPRLIPADKLALYGLNDLSALNLDYGKNLLWPQGIIKSQYSLISSNLPVTKRPLSIKKAVSKIKKQGLHFDHPYFKLINANLSILFQLKDLLAESSGKLGGEESAFIKSCKQALNLINRLELYYKYYINQVVARYGDHCRKDLGNDKEYVIRLYEKAKKQDLLDIESTAIQVEDGQSGYLYREAEGAISLNPGASGLQYGKHKVIMFDGVYYKYQPYAPGIEFAINSLYNNIAGGITPPTKLIKIMHTQTKEQAIYLASVSMGLVNFQEIIDDQEIGYVDKIDLDNFSNLFLLSLLTSPGDAKPDNFVVDFVRSKTGELESVRLISVDNDISFCKGKLGVQTLSGKAQIYSDVLNILYFLPQMDMAISSKLVSELTQSRTKVIEVLSRWLKDLHMQNARYQYLSANNFTKQELEDLNLPIKLKSGTLVEIYHKLDQIVKWLEDNPYITHSNILKKIYPGISYFYEKIREGNNNNPFNAIKQAYAAAADSQELADALQSRNAIESRTAWSAISTSRMMNHEQFSQIFKNTIEQEAEQFIAAIDFSFFQAEDKALFTIMRNNLFFARNLNLHNISFEQLQELLEEREIFDSKSSEIKMRKFEHLTKVTLSYSKIAMIPHGFGGHKFTNLLRKMGVKCEIIQKTVELETTMSKKIKLVAINDTRKINEQQDKEGNSKLHLAVINNQIKQVEALLNLGIDDSLRNKQNYTALDLAGQDHEKIAIYQLLADHQPEVFWAAVNSKSVKEATRLASTMSITKLQMPVQTEVVRMMSQPIYLAIEDERMTDLAYMLVSRGVKLSQSDKEGNNILHLISIYYQQDSAMGLINYIVDSYNNLGLSLDIRNKEGYLPADIAVREKKYNLLSAYLNEGYGLVTYDHEYGLVSDKDNIQELGFSFNLKLCALVGKYGIKLKVEDITQGLDLGKCNAKGKNILHICAKLGDYNLFTKIIAMNLPDILREQIQEGNIWQVGVGSKEEYHQFAKEETRELAMLYHKYNFTVSLKEVIIGFSPKKVNELGNNLIYEILKTLCFEIDTQIEKWQDFKLAIKNIKNGQIDMNYTEKANGHTPLHFAITSMQGEKYIKKLIKYGPSELPNNKFGNTAYELAQYHQQGYELAPYLLSFLATKQQGAVTDDFLEETIMSQQDSPHQSLAGEYSFTGE